ncbi:hypothetical protein, partial [Salmonella sp. s51228]|uniref:hypothetical protein n=1 Tax=Salmonella sp. s51228 TaxID=3159652 RepID=UPI00397FD731
MIEVIYQHLSMIKTKSMQTNETFDVNNSRSHTSSQPYGMVQINSGLNEVQKGVYAIIRSYLDDTGPSIRDIVRSLSNRFSEQQVRDAVEFL